MSLRAPYPRTLAAVALVTACGIRPGTPAAVPSDVAPGSASHAGSPRLVDPHATPETRALFENLSALSGRHVLFGHQDDLAYGVFWRDEPGRSDVRETVGSYPAVYGWDAGHIELAAPANLDRNNFAKMRRWIAEAYGRGGVVTLSWHLDNPVSGGNAWDTTRAVAAVLPGGPRNPEYRRWLDRLADYIRTLRGPRGEAIPIVFRPYHEMSGSWFWWGGRNATPEEYRALWRFTVEYLRDTRGLHNLLYAYSPDAVDTPEKYLERYPGDDYVDVLGLDDYQSITSPAKRATLAARLRMLVELADSRGKIPAFTETGLVTIPDSTWWTGTLLPGIAGDSLTRRIAWVLVWRNANRASDRPDHFYAPYPGQVSAADFVRFRHDPLIWFGDDLPDLYRAGMPPRAPATRTD